MGDYIFDGNATSTGDLVAGDSTTNLKFHNKTFGAYTLPTITSFNSSLPGSSSGIGVWEQGLILIEGLENADKDSNPSLIFASTNPENSVNITYSTSTDSLEFRDAVSYYFRDGNVGIATSSPSSNHKFAVTGNSIFEGSGEFTEDLLLDNGTDESPKLTFGNTNQNYSIYSTSTTGDIPVQFFRGETSGIPLITGFVTKDADGTDDNFLSVAGIGSPGAFDDRHLLNVGWSSVDSNYLIESNSNGTEDTQPLKISVADSNSIDMDTDGTFVFENDVDLSSGGMDAFRFQTNSTHGFNSSSGADTFFNLSAKMSQSGTAGYTMQYMNVDNSAFTGSGLELMAQWAVEGLSVFDVDIDGNTRMGESLTLNLAEDAIDPYIEFSGETNNGQFKWDESEGVFQFQDTSGNYEEIFAGFDSSIGDPSGRYLRIEDIEYGDLGILPTITNYGSSGGGAEDGLLLGMEGGLNVIETTQTNNNPVINLAAHDVGVGGTFNTASITFATSTSKLQFTGADEYTLDNDLVTTGNIVVDNGISAGIQIGTTTRNSLWSVDGNDLFRPSEFVNHVTGQFQTSLNVDVYQVDSDASNSSAIYSHLYAKNSSSTTSGISKAIQGGVSIYGDTGEDVASVYGSVSSEDVNVGSAINSYAGYFFNNSVATTTYGVYSKVENEGDTNYAGYFDGDFYVSGNATTTGYHAMGFDSTIGDTSGRHLRIEDIDYGILGTVPVIKNYGSSGGGIADGTILGLEGSLNILETTQSYNDPQINLAAHDADSTGNIAKIKYSTTTQSMDFEDASTYTFDGKIGIGTTSPGYELEVVGDIHATGNVTEGSSRDIKSDFEDLDNQNILSGIKDLDIQEWSYNNSPDYRHIGPVAEDFYEQFGLGDSNKHISATNVAGVALVGIQALSEKLGYFEMGLLNIEDLTEEEQDTFLEGLVKTLTKALEKLTGSIKAGGDWVFNRIRTDELCIEDVCLTADELQEIKNELQTENSNTSLIEDSSNDNSEETTEEDTETDEEGDDNTDQTTEENENNSEEETTEEDTETEEEDDNTDQVDEEGVNDSEEETTEDNTESDEESTDDNTDQVDEEGVNDSEEETTEEDTETNEEEDDTDQTTEENENNSEEETIKDNEVDEEENVEDQTENNNEEVVSDVSEPEPSEEDNNNQESED